VNHLLSKKLDDDPLYNILKYYCIGCGVLGLLAIGCGVIFSLFSMIQLGVMQCFIMFVIVYLLRFKQYERLVIANETNSKVADNQTGAERQQSDERIPSVPETKLKKYRDRSYPLLLLCTSIIALLIEFFIFNELKFRVINDFDKPPIFIGVFCILVSFLYLISVNWFKQSVESGEEYQMLSYFFKSGQWLSFSGGLALILKYFGFGRIEHWLSYLMVAFLVIIFLEVGGPCVIRLMDGKANNSPALKLTILSALLSGRNPINVLLISLEKHTGISFRSTWTVGFIRRNILLIIFVLVAFFWLMTIFVQVNPDEQGILYHFGRIKRAESMLPGLHCKWPWPVETAKIYPVSKVQNFTVGYESEFQADYLWTMNHGGDEYKLLLGDGRELVSINMRVYYKIDNLYQYVSRYESPIEILKAEAYRILLYETVVTSLDHLLSHDRASFSKMFSQKLQKTSKQQKLGLDVITVTLTGIHPPTEMAYEYQEFVSAYIQKQVIIIKAKMDAEAAIPRAEKLKGEMIKNAQVDALARKGQSHGEFQKYKYQENAYHLNPDAYKEWKWLEVFEHSLKNKKIYLLDKKQTVNQSGLWLDMRKMFNEKSTKNE
jgi:regulator of protease activity HflC (stomatin/prohibitin superfamily)